MTLEHILNQLKHANGENIVGISRVLSEDELLKLLQFLKNHPHVSGIHFHRDQIGTDALSQVNTALARNRKIGAWFSLINAIVASQADESDVLRFSSDNPGFDINCIDAEGHSALHIAAIKGHVPLIKLLSMRGAELLLRDKESNTALHLAARHGQLSAVECITHLNSEEQFLNRINHRKKTALGEARLAGHSDIYNYLGELNRNISSVPKPKTTKTSMFRQFANSLRRTASDGQINSTNANRQIEHEALLQGQREVATYLQAFEQCISQRYFRVDAGGKQLNIPQGDFTVPHRVYGMHRCLKRAKQAPSLQQFGRELLDARQCAVQAKQVLRPGRASATKAFYEAWIKFGPRLRNFATEPLQARDFPCFDAFQEYLNIPEDDLTITSPSMRSNTRFQSLYPNTEAPLVVTRQMHSTPNPLVHQAKRTTYDMPNTQLARSRPLKTRVTSLDDGYIDRYSSKENVGDVQQRVAELETHVNHLSTQLSELGDAFRYLHNDYENLKQQHQEMLFATVHERMALNWEKSLRHHAHASHRLFFDTLLTALNKINNAAFVIDSNYIDRSKLTNQENIAKLLFAIMDALPFAGIVTNSGVAVKSIFEMVHDAESSIDLVNQVIPDSVKDLTNKFLSIFTGAGDERLSRMVSYARSLTELERRIFEICRTITMVYGEQIVRLNAISDVIIFANEIADIIIKIFKDGDQQNEKILLSPDRDEQILLGLSTVSKSIIRKEVTIKDLEQSDIKHRVSVRRLLQDTALKYHIHGVETIRRIEGKNENWIHLYGCRQLTEEQANYLMEKTSKRSWVDISAPSSSGDGVSAAQNISPAIPILVRSPLMEASASFPPPNYGRANSPSMWQCFPSSVIENEYQLDAATVASRRAVNRIEINGENKPCVVVPTAADGNCGFSAIAQMLFLQDHGERPLSYIGGDRSLFIQWVDAQVKKERIDEPLLQQMFARANTQDIDSWSRAFVNSSHYMEDIHFRLLSKYFNCIFEIYHIPTENHENAFKPVPTYERIDERPVAESSHGRPAPLVIQLAHIATTHRPQSLNHFEGIIIEPSQQQLAAVAHMLEGAACYREDVVSRSAYHR